MVVEECQSSGQETWSVNLHKLVGVGVPARQAYGNGTRAVWAMPTAERRNNGGQGGGGAVTMMNKLRN